jgi:hypothetical protein
VTQLKGLFIVLKWWGGRGPYFHMAVRTAAFIAVLVGAPSLIGQEIENKDKDDATGRGREIARRQNIPKSAPAAAAQAIATPTSFSITPTAAPGSVFSPMNPNLRGLPNYTAGQPMTTAASPDGKTLLVSHQRLQPLERLDRQRSAERR